MYLNLISDFEDMSCDMVYGQAPPTFEEDPASKQPCYADICKYDALVFNRLKDFRILTWQKLVGSVANPSSSVCPKLQT